MTGRSGTALFPQDTPSFRVFRPPPPYLVSHVHIFYQLSACSTCYFGVFLSLSEPPPSVSPHHQVSHLPFSALLNISKPISGPIFTPAVSSAAAELRAAVRHRWKLGGAIGTINRNNQSEQAIGTSNRNNDVDERRVPPNASNV